MQNNNVVPSEQSIAQSGTRFYVLSASSPVTIQPVRAGAIGASNQFGTAQGQPVLDGFDTLTVRNYSMFPTVALVWVGFDDFIDNQLVLNNTAFTNAVMPTYPIPNAATAVIINDLSGQAFTDINGKRWGAIARIALQIFNSDGGVTLLIQRKGASTSSGAAIGVVFPLTGITLPVQGDYALNNGGGNVNAVVSEIYAAIPL